MLVILRTNWGNTVSPIQKGKMLLGFEQSEKLYFEL